VQSSEKGVKGASSAPAAGEAILGEGQSGAGPVSSSIVRRRRKRHFFSSLEGKGHFQAEQGKGERVSGRIHEKIEPRKGRKKKC